MTNNETTSVLIDGVVDDATVWTRPAKGMSSISVRDAAYRYCWP